MFQFIPESTFLIFLFFVIAVILKFSLHIPINNGTAWSKSFFWAIPFTIILSIMEGLEEFFIIDNIVEFLLVWCISYIYSYIVFGNYLEK